MPNNQASTIGTISTLSELLALRGEAKHLHLTRGKILATRSGGHLSRFRGRGMEFDESRQYQAGDEVRNMDWRVTARAGKPHVKLFREERERPVWLLVDLGPSMRFGTRVAFKSVIAARVAALLAWAAAEQGDRVGGLVFDETQHFECRPAARMRGLLPLLHALTQSPVPSNKNKGYSSLHEAALHLQNLVRPGSLVFLLSDFSELNQANTSWLIQIGSICELVLVHIYDPLEQTAPVPGLYPVTDGTNRGILEISGPFHRQHWAQRFLQHKNLLESVTSSYQAHLLSLATNAALGETLALGLRPRLLANIR